MMKAYDYLYFGVYRTLLKTIDKDFAEYSAILIALYISVVLLKLLLVCSK